MINASGSMGRILREFQAMMDKKNSTAAPTPPQGPAYHGTGDLRGALASMFPAGSKAGAVWQLWSPAMGESLGLARGLAEEENQRRTQTIGYLQKEKQKADIASRPMGEEERGLRMGRINDAAAGQALDNWGTLRGHLGAAGITGGGLAAGLGSQIEMQRLGQVQGGKRDLAIYEMERQAQNASDSFLRSMGLAQYMNQGPSMIESDQFNSLIDTGVNTYLGMEEIEASKYAAKQNKKAGKASGVGSVIGGALSAI